MAFSPVATRSLYCTGQSYIEGGAKQDEAILQFDPANRGFVLETAAFRAEGTGSVSQAEYAGRLTTTDGSVHAFVLNRYTSEFVASREGSGGDTVEFRGICRTGK